MKIHSHFFYVGLACYLGARPVSGTFLFPDGDHRAELVKGALEGWKLVSEVELDNGEASHKHRGPKVAGSRKREAVEVVEVVRVLRRQGGATGTTLPTLPADVGASGTTSEASSIGAATETGNGSVGEATETGTGTGTDGVNGTGTVDGATVTETGTVDEATETETGSATTSETMTGAINPNPNPTDAPTSPLGACTADGYGGFIPFCYPHNGTIWRLKDNLGDLYVTWNPAFFDANDTVLITLNYKNATDDGAPKAIWDDNLLAAVGWAVISPKSSWLEGYGDTVDVYLTIQKGKGGEVHWGPTFSVTSKPGPPPNDPFPDNRPPVNTVGLAIGLPVVIIFIIVMVLGTHFCMRERRKVGPIHIGGVRGRGGYGVGRSRIQRMKGSVGAPLGMGNDLAVPPGAPKRPARQSGLGWEMTDVQGGRARDDDAREHRDETAGSRGGDPFVDEQGRI